jgi:hypothetical protein
MISDDPDEDADNLDDEKLLGSYFSAGSSESPPGSAAESEIADWPAMPGPGDSAGDSETLHWFRTNNPGWRGEMTHVLRAWIASRVKTR